MFSKDTIEFSVTFMVAVTVENSNTELQFCPYIWNDSGKESFLGDKQLDQTHSKLHRKDLNTVWLKNLYSLSLDSIFFFFF